MSRIQRLIMKLVPARWAQEMEADSRRWMLTCQTCGLERSIWDIGGVRWKATGKTRVTVHCPHCGRLRNHTATYRQ